MFTMVNYQLHGKTLVAQVLTLAEAVQVEKEVVEKGIEELA